MLETMVMRYLWLRKRQPEVESYRRRAYCSRMTFSVKD